MVYTAPRKGGEKMNIKEIEQATGLPRANIRFYEEKKLIDPLRGENGYRIYEPVHVEELKRIQLLRSLDFSIEEIRSLQTGGRTMDSLLEEKEIHWVKEKKAAESAAETCRIMRADKVDYHTLDAEKYRQKLPPAWEVNLPFRKDRSLYPFTPFRRLMARSVDFAWLGVLWDGLLAGIFHISPFEQSGFMELLALIAQIVLVLLLEPVFLHLFGTTPGKWILGLHIRDSEGGKLSLATARDRTKQVLWRGEGLYLPIYQWFRLWKSYRDCAEGIISSWDYENSVSYTLKDRKGFRWFLLIFVQCLAFLVLSIQVNLSAMPPNRGDVTIAQFAENYNFVLDYLDYDGSRRMGPDGKWLPDPEGEIIIRVMEETGYPEPWFRVDEKGHVTAVGFDETVRNGQSAISGRHSLAYLLAYTAAISQPEAHLLAYAPTQFVEKIPSDQLADHYVVSLLGVQVMYECRYEGYNAFSSDDILYATEDENEWEIHFRVTVE